MLNKRYISFIALIITAALIFSACGGSTSTKDAIAAAPAAPAAPMAPQYKASASMAPMMEAEDMEMAEEMGIVANTASGGSANTAAVAQQRKIIKHSNMDLETKDFDTAFAQITDAVSRSGGYIESQNISGQSMRNKDRYYERSANINARIPAEKLDEITGTIGGICNVTSHWEGIDDITDSYFDVEARLNTMRLQEERLLDILSKAESLEDIITLEAKLSDVRYEIESLTARIRRMDSQVAYSYLNLNLREVVEYQNVASAPKTFGERISDAFVRSGNRLRNFFEGAVIFAIEDLPLMLIRIVIFAVIVVVAYRFIRWIYIKCMANNRKNIFAKTKKALNNSAPENKEEPK